MGVIPGRCDLGWTSQKVSSVPHTRAAVGRTERSVRQPLWETPVSTETQLWLFKDFTLPKMFLTVQKGLRAFFRTTFLSVNLKHSADYSTPISAKISPLLPTAASRLLSMKLLKEYRAFLSNFSFSGRKIGHSNLPCVVQHCTRYHLLGPRPPRPTPYSSKIKLLGRLLPLWVFPFSSQ